MSGYLFKLIRESIPMTQVELAERLAVDLNTVQGWELGRRPLTSMRALDLARLRMKMTGLGVQPSLFELLSDAFEADLVIADAVEAGARVADPVSHPLAAVVHRRDLTNLITWPVTGVTPTQLANLATGRPVRRGPVSDRPVLHADERARFFDHLLTSADAFRKDEHVLLRRQAIYLLGFDDRETSSQWLLDEQNKSVSAASRAGDIPSWVAVRSSAIALARNGNKEPLRRFVETGLSTDMQQTANLNYWAYWLGEIPEAQADDGFMIDAHPNRWAGTRVIEHLLGRLRPGSDHADLNIHTLWTLLLARPAVLDHQPDLRRLALTKIAQTEADPDLGSRTRQELASVAYAIRLADR
ncbi:DNA-binding transcriptional regulator [Kutzneria buriramensis]|uniref:helix-turn-helix domain-containing protein n=1 Tax=Kutzneria buriramensis TaxID=1045776 RepID=UPI0011C1BC62|nr:XRE family transcriptional regulator [Kutzneria buriramensis]